MSYKEPRALTTDFGLIILAGDLGGTAATPSVLKINGTSVPASPSANQVLVATSSTVSIWSNIFDGYIASNANIAVSKLAAGSSAQVLITNVTTPTWTTLSTDVTVNATGTTTVNSISGTSPVSVTTASIFQWGAGVSTPTLKQADNTTNGATAQALKIQSQNATGTTSTGGQLTLTSGTGITSAGIIVLQTGGTTRLTINATGVITIANLGTGVVHTDSSGNLTSSLVVNADVSATAAIAVSKLAVGTAGQFLTTNSGATADSFVSISGDATASTSTPGALTIIALQGNAVQSGTLTSSNDGYVLTWHNASTQWQALPASTSGGGTSNLTGPITATPIRSNTSNLTYTIDSTGGTGDYLILNKNTATALSGTFTTTTGSATVTSTVSAVVSVGQGVIFTTDTFVYLVAAVSGTTITLATVYQGTGASGVSAKSYSYFSGMYVLPAPTTGRLLTLKDITGVAGTNPMVILPHASETIDGTALTIALTGTASAASTTSGVTTITGSSTTFLSQVNAGNQIKFSAGTSGYFTVLSVTSNTSLTIAGTYTITGTPTITLASYIYNTNYGVLRLQSDGTNWFIV